MPNSADNPRPSSGLPTGFVRILRNKRGAALLSGSLVLPTDISLPYSIAPGVQLDRASDAERDAFRKLLFQPAIGFVPDHEAISSEASIQGKGTSYDVQLGPAQWRYVVLRDLSSDPDDQTALRTVEQSLRLTDPDLSTTANYFEQEDEHSVRSVKATRTSFPGHQVEHGATLELDLAWLEQLTSVIRHLGNLDQQQFPGISRALSIFLDLSGIRTSHPLWTLGQFATIEALVTRKPKQTDPLESITNQVGRAVRVLNNRMDSPIRFGDFADPNMDMEKLVRSLYEFRSLIAHGRMVLRPYDDLSSSPNKPIRCLRSPNNAGRLTHIIARDLLRHALSEPQLVHDLQGD